MLRERTPCGDLRARRGVVRAGEIAFVQERTDDASGMRVVAAGPIHVSEGQRVVPDVSVRDTLVLGSHRRGRAGRAVVLRVDPDLKPTDLG